MRDNASRLHEKGWIKANLDLTRTTDILWTYSSPKLYELLVIKSSWSIDDYGDHVGEAMIAALLHDPQPTTH